MLTYYVIVTLAIYFSFSAFVCCFFNFLVLNCGCETQLALHS